MSPTPLSPETAVDRLMADGFEVEVVGSHLIVHAVPYVTAERTVEQGKLAIAMTMAGDRPGRPGSHVVNFVGRHPCNQYGREFASLKHLSERKELYPGFWIDHSFSNKPREGYDDYYHLMTNYIAIISHEATAIDPTATARTKRVIEGREDSPFVYADSASARSGTTAAASRLGLSAVGIVGLGGTGSYILDLVAKTPVQSIHLFDGDDLEQHNAFRAPGAATLDELRARPKKVEHHASRYGAMHKGIVPHALMLDEGNLGLLDDMDFVFVSMDATPEKARIVSYLEDRGMTFIDCGMGLLLENGMVLGQLRVTTSTKENREAARERIPLSSEDDDPVYRQNVQIAELNALNAVLAVLKWKKLMGFYHDLENEQHSVFSIDGNHLANQ